MSDALTRLNAALEGRYRIERELGEGAMATVYLADDLKHERKVALKVLKPELAAVVGAERFLAEIKTTANLQHPHILPLFDSGEADSFVFYVMPFVEGESLRQRLDREHQLPVDETIRIATDLAEALDYAHRQGVIHRDIKPANILLSRGRPLVADFGIALAVRAAGGDRLTETGLSVGTPHYMSPEQATGDRTVGPATDTYALGCVLYEMLVGEPPYTGGTAQAILGKIIAGEPESVSAQRKSVPANVDAVIAKALEKLPADRFTGAQEFARALSEPAFRHGGRAKASAAVGRRSGLAIGWAAVMTVVAVTAVWTAWRARAATEARPVRFSTVPPGSRAPTGGLAFSPDGSHVVYAAGQGSSRQLFLLPLDQFRARPIQGTEGASGPFFSPDGQWVGFFAEGTLRKVALAGGDPQTIADSIGPTFRGASWGPDDMILIGARRGGLLRVPAVGGSPRLVSAPDVEAGELGHSMPSVLPNGNAVLFTVVTGMNLDATHIEVLSLSTGERRVVAEDGYDARYAPTGHVVYARSTSLYALSFDASLREVSGEPVPVLENIRVNRGAQFTADFGFSDTGALVYVPEGSGVWTDTLLWVDREGNSSAILSTAGRLSFPHLAPDGSRAAVTTADEGLETWIVELERPGLSRFTFQGDNHLSVWTPDGERIVFSSNRDGPVDLFWRRSDGTGEAELLYASPQHKDGGSWSPDGKLMTFAEVSPETGWDIWVLSADSTRRARPLLQSRFAEYTPMISPNGRWLAYTSDESGRFEVSVMPFPDGGRKAQVSLEGGIEPLWGRDGRELFYRTGDSVMAVTVTDTTHFDVGRPELLFRGAYSRRSGFGFPNYDVTPDGDRFLMVKVGPPAEESTRLNFVLNWFEELKQRMGN